VLSEKEYFIFCLYFLQGYSIIEIAEQLGLSRQAVNKTKNKVKEKLRKYYREEESF